jgi:ElaA protein
MVIKISWFCKHFDELTASELYGILSLRENVFVVEQNCVYLDADGKDKDSYLVVGINELGEVVATSRILPKGISYKNYASIGRVCVAQSVRRFSVGQELMKETLHFMEQLLGKQTIKISAQTYLLNFYKKYDFEPLGEEYLEDDIPHIAMIRKG